MRLGVPGKAATFEKSKEGEHVMSHLLHHFQDPNSGLVIDCSSRQEFEIIGSHSVHQGAPFSSVLIVLSSIETGDAETGTQTFV